MEKVNNKVDWDNLETMYFTLISISKFLKLFLHMEEVQKPVLKGILAIERVYQMTGVDDLCYLIREGDAKDYSLKQTEDYWETMKKKVLEYKKLSSWNMMAGIRVDIFLKTPDYRSYRKELELKEIFGGLNVEEKQKSAWVHIVENEMAILEETIKILNEHYKN